MQEDSQQTQLILDAIPSLVFLKDTSNRILQVNRAVLDMLDLPREAVEGHLSSEIYPKDAERFYADDLEVIQSGQAKIDYTEAVGDRWLRTDKIPVRNANGQIDRILVVATDVTELKRAKDEQQRALRLLEATSQMTNVGGWELDPTSEELSWSDQICHIYEVPVGSTPTLKEAINYYSPKSQAKIERHVQLAIETGEPWDLELLLWTAKRNKTWVRAIGRAETVDGKCVRLWGTLQDISERKQRDEQLETLNQTLSLRAQEADEARTAAEHAKADLAQVVTRLSESEERYRTLFEKSPVMHADVDLDDATIKDCNQTLVERLGCQSKGELIGQSLLSLYSEDCQAEAEQVFQQFVQSDEISNVPLRLLTRQGNEIPVVLKMAAVRDASGQTISGVSTWSDVSALTQANKDLEEFAYVASHDLKAPLRAISHLSTWLEEDLGDNLSASSGQHLAQLKQRVRRMDRLLDDLLAYSRAGTAAGQVARHDLGEILAGIAGLHGSNEHFVLCLDLAIREVEICRTPVETILRNLIDNAIKHHDKEETCRITIATHQQANHLEVVVSDNGPGIPADLRDRAFRIFHTLRPRDEVEGSGMGLALVKRLVETVGGTIGLESADPHGLQIRFTWPLGT